MNKMVYIEDDTIANLWIVENNPLIELNSLKYPLTVFVKGRKLDRATLDYFDEKSRNRKNLMASALRYLENLILEKWILASNKLLW